MVDSMKQLILLLSVAGFGVACVDKPPAEDSTSITPPPPPAPAATSPSGREGREVSDEPPPPPGPGEATCTNEGDCWKALGDPPSDASWECAEGRCVVRGAGPFEANP